MTLTFDEYDELCDMLDGIENEDPDWLPDAKDLQKYAGTDFPKYYKFLIWLSETCNVPTDEAGKENYRMLNKILRENLILE